MFWQVQWIHHIRIHSFVFQQMAVFSAQLQWIYEQREYYRLKHQKLLGKTQN